MYGCEHCVAELEYMGGEAVRALDRAEADRTFERGKPWS